MSVWVRSRDGVSLVPAEEITALTVVGRELQARVGSMGVVVLAAGDADELALAARELMPGIDRLNDADYVVEATGRDGGIHWDAAATDGSAGAGWGAAASGGTHKKSGRPGR